ncbi:hypothetical protein YC2023_009396 [Brassica napus]
MKFRGNQILCFLGISSEIPRDIPRISFSVRIREGLSFSTELKELQDSLNKEYKKQRELYGDPENDGNVPDELFEKLRMAHRERRRASYEALRKKHESNLLEESKGESIKKGGSEGAQMLAYVSNKVYTRHLLQLHTKLLMESDKFSRLNSLTKFYHPASHYIRRRILTGKNNTRTTNSYYSKSSFGTTLETYRILTFVKFVNSTKVAFKIATKPKNRIVITYLKGFLRPSFNIAAYRSLRHRVVSIVGRWTDSKTLRSGFLGGNSYNDRMRVRPGSGQTNRRSSLAVKNVVGRSSRLRQANHPRQKPRGLKLLLHA